MNDDLSWNQKLPNWAKGLLGGLAAILAITGIAITVTLVDDDGNGTPDTIKVVVNAQHGDSQPTETIKVPEPAVDKAKDQMAGDEDHKDLEAAPPNTEPPTDAQIEQAAEVQTQVKALPEAGAVQGFAGCVTRILPANFSSRNGARATWQVLHYTVSANRPGWSDVNAIIALFSNPGRQASSNFVIDSDGNCAYIVPIESKAWTQAGGNPWSVSYEIIATGGEPRYLEPPGQAKLTSVMRQVAKRTAIPLRAGAVSSSCTPVRSGIVQHKDFGLCGGGHVDIDPFSVATVLAWVKGPVPVLTARERKIVAGARRPKGTGHSKGYWCKRLSNQVAWLGRSPKQPRRAKRIGVLKRVSRGSC
jgi:hypothetical protein